MFRTSLVLLPKKHPSLLERKGHNGFTGKDSSLRHCGDLACYLFGITFYILAMVAATTTSKMKRTRKG
jgi:hypothetical protein